MQRGGICCIFYQRSFPGGIEEAVWAREWENDRYHLIDVDNDDAEISPAEAVKDVVPFVAE